MKHVIKVPDNVLRKMSIPLWRWYAQHLANINQPEDETEYEENYDGFGRTFHTLNPRVAAALTALAQGDGEKYREMVEGPR